MRLDIPDEFWGWYEHHLMFTRYEMVHDFHFFLGKRLVMILPNILTRNGTRSVAYYSER